MNKLTYSSFSSYFFGIILCSALFIPTAWAETAVWKVSKGNHHMYIGGTIHMLSQSDYPLPEAFEKAYTASEKIIFEADMPMLHSSAFQQKLMGSMIYLDGSTLKQKISSQTYADLQAYLAQKQLQPYQFIMLKPSMVSITLMMLELKALGMADTGVDAHFYAKALKDKKAMGHLEDGNEQIALLANMGAGKEDEFIQFTLKEMNNLEKFMTDIKIAWRNGDEKGIEKIGITPLKRDFPMLYEDMLVKRNKNWLPKLTYLIQTPETEFILVGAAHLPGKEGVLELLKQKGFSIKQM